MIKRKEKKKDIKKYDDARLGIKILFLFIESMIFGDPENNIYFPLLTKIRFQIVNS